MSKLEELTEDERELNDPPARRKALRIIDAHAADRAALVARVAELEREVERLTCIPCDADKRVAESECATLRQRLEAAERGWNHSICVSAKRAQARDAAEARVRELEAELAQTRKAAITNAELVDEFESECATLRQRLEVAERAKAEWERLRNDAYCLYREEASKRESEVADLRAELDMQRRRADHHQGAAEALRADRATLVAQVAELEAEVMALQSEVDTLRDVGNGRVLVARHEFGDDSDCVKCGAYGPNEESAPCVSVAESEVTRLRTQLAAAEAKYKVAEAMFAVSDADRRREWQRADAAESEVADLRAELASLKGGEK